MARTWTLGGIESREALARWILSTHYKLIYRLLFQSHNARREMGFIVYRNHSISEVIQGEENRISLPSFPDYPTGYRARVASYHTHHHSLAEAFSMVDYLSSIRNDQVALIGMQLEDGGTLLNGVKLYPQQPISKELQSLLEGAAFLEDRLNRGLGTDNDRKQLSEMVVPFEELAFRERLLELLPPSLLKIAYNNLMKEGQEEVTHASL